MSNSSRSIGMFSENSIQSPKYLQLALPNSAFDIEVVKHRVDNDGDLYDDHVFSIDVHCEFLYYVVERTYVDFVNLHAKLRKKFPQCEVPSLPLAGAVKLQKKLTRDESRKSSSGRDESRKSFGGQSDPPRKSQNFSFAINEADEEDVGSKLPELQVYLRTLLTFHEIVVSSEFASFLDEEIGPNEIEVLKYENLNEISILLVRFCSLSFQRLSYFQYR
jgi:hypothetical protein